MTELIKEIFTNEYERDTTSAEKTYDPSKMFNRFIRNQQMFYYGRYTKEDVEDAVMDATLILYERWLADPTLMVSKRSIQYRTGDILSRKIRKESGYTQRGSVPKGGLSLHVMNVYDEHGQNRIEKMGYDEDGNLLMGT